LGKLNKELPKYTFPTLVGQPITGYQTVQYGIFNTFGKDGQPNGVDFTINNRPFSSVDDVTNYRQIYLGDTEEWTLISKNGLLIGPVSHPFHIHVNPFEVISRIDVNGKELVDFPHWKDTQILNQGEKVTFRTRYEDFPGSFVQHCHILDHEDQGMMEIVDIVPRPPPKALSLAPPQILVQLKTDQPVPKQMVLLDAINNPTVLTPKDFIGKTTVVFLFRGLKCYSCSKQISGLEARFKDFKDHGIDVIGISSESTKELKRGLKKFQVPFRMFSDITGRVFKDFGCHHGHFHGTFIIGKNGFKRFENVAVSPYDDIQNLLDKAIDVNKHEE